MTCMSCMSCNDMYVMYAMSAMYVMYVMNVMQCMYVCMYACVYVWMYVRMYLCICICIFTCRCMCRDVRFWTKCFALLPVRFWTKFRLDQRHAVPSSVVAAGCFCVSSLYLGVSGVHPGFSHQHRKGFEEGAKGEVLFVSCLRMVLWYVWGRWGLTSPSSPSPAPC